MYQYSTFTPLVVSKKYFKTINECVQWLKKCVKKTNDFRKTENKKAVTLTDIELGQRLLNIDDTNPDIFNILGPETEISINNLLKNPVRCEDLDE